MKIQKVNEERKWKCLTSENSTQIYELKSNSTHLRRCQIIIIEVEGGVMLQI